MSKCLSLLVYYIVFFLYIFNSIVIAQDAPNTNSLPSTNNGTQIPNTTNTYPSELNSNTTNLNQGVSAFSSSFSGYSSYGSQCGLSISGGYINNGYQNSYQILTTFNTNPCTNQSDIENIRQNNENKREVVRANANIITACINARTEAVKNRVNPDTICKLDDFQIPRTP